MRPCWWASCWKQPATGGAVNPALPDPLTTEVTLLATDPEGLSASVTGRFVTDWESHPRVVSAEAHGSDGSLIVTFNQALRADPAPAASQFTVNVVNADESTGSNAVTGVSVIRTLLILQLEEKPLEGQILTLDYAHEDAAPLKRAAEGGDSAPGFTGQAVQVVEGLVTAQQGDTDYDTDDDGLIEIDSAAKLNALRWDADGNGLPSDAGLADYKLAFPNAPTGMGCPSSGCEGYEIGAGADGEAAITIDLGVAPYNTGAGWVPINGFATTLEGNGHTIDGLFIDRTALDSGLFGVISATGRVQNLKLTNVNVTGRGQTGTLAGQNSGHIAAVSAAGNVESTGGNAFGGLVGHNSSGGTLAAVHVSVTVSKSGAFQTDKIGGLVGQNDGRIVASYATGAVSVPR